MGITVRGLVGLKPGKWLTEPGNRNEGALRAKGSPHGARFYFRYRDSAGCYDDYPLGSFDEAGKRGMTLADVKQRVRRLRDRYLSGATDLRAVLESEVREAERVRSAAKQQAAKEAAEQKATLGVLLAAYVEQLRKDGKASARQVERAITRHVQEAWPKLWFVPAERVGAEDLLAVIAKIVDAGKFREAAKLRAYLRAAYAAAIRARQDARSIPALRDLRITTNPARDLVTIEGASQTRGRALSVAELRAYWARIEKLADPTGALLRFHLLTGGQRAAQLARLTTEDYDPDLVAVQLRDGKGRRKVARLHVVPLIPSAGQALADMVPERVGPHLFTVTAGVSGAVYSTAQHRLREVVDAMQKAGELEKGPFTVGDLRRTVETRLAAEGVSEEIRAQLQSHGLGGVQARHYDRHDYFAEKLSALETLYRVLSGQSASVVSLKQRRGR